MAFLRRSKKRVYLDWASAAPVLPEALSAFKSSISVFGNPSSAHTEGRQAKVLLESARTTIARLVGVKSPSVIFTSGATEANTLAIQGRIERCLLEGMTYKDMHVLYLPTMHSSVTKTVRHLETMGVCVEEIPMTGTTVHVDALSALITSSTILICMDAVCGETGTRFDTLKVRRVLDSHSSYSKAILHIDATQLPLVERIEYTRLGADLLVFDAQKVGGVRGMGCLIAPHSKAIAPTTFGGGQEQGMRPGTEPVALASAFAAALSKCAKHASTFAVQAAKDRQKLIASIETAIPTARILTSKSQAPHILTMSFPGLDTDYMIALLDRDGFTLSTRSACETDSENGSPVVYQLTGNQELAASTLRVSWGPTTRSYELETFVTTLKEITTFLSGT